MLFRFRFRRPNFSNWGGEPIAASSNSYQINWSVRVIPQGLAELINANFQHGLANAAVAPHRIQQLILGYKVAAPFNQIT